MSTPIFRPFHETIVEMVDSLNIERLNDFEVLNTLALLTTDTIVPRAHRMAVATAFARKAKSIRDGESFWRPDTVILTNVERAIDAMAQQDDSD